MGISLIEYNSKEHFELIEKWMDSPELLEGWGAKPMSKDKLETWVEAPNSLFLIICIKPHKNPIGFICFYNINNHEGTAERGTFIEKIFQNKGYGKESILASNLYIRQSLGIKRIIVWVKDKNKKSLHITQSLGYTYDYFDNKKSNHYFHMDLI